MHRCSQCIYLCILLINKGFHKAEISYLSCAVLVRYLYSFSGDFTWCFLYCVFIYSLLIKKGLCECQNVSVKFPCVYLCLLSGYLFIFFVLWKVLFPWTLIIFLFALVYNMRASLLVIWQMPDFSSLGINCYCDKFFVLYVFLKRHFGLTDNFVNWENISIHMLKIPEDCTVTMMYVLEEYNLIKWKSGKENGIIIS